VIRPPSQEEAEELAGFREEDVITQAAGIMTNGLSEMGINVGT